MKTHRSRERGESGAAAVELALVLPLLILLLGGIIDFGFAFNAQISLTHAAREGVRVEAVGLDDPAGAAQAAYSAPAATIDAVSVAGCAGQDSQARVTITAHYDFFLLPFGSRQLEGQAVMRCGR